MPDRKPPEQHLGEWTLYAISDGLYRLDGGAMFGVVPKVLWEKVKPPDERNRIDMCLSCLLAVKKGLTVLIEAGIGSKNTKKFEFIYGVDHITSIDEELGRLGMNAEEIDHVILSHLHFDHSGSLTVLEKDGKIVPHFPNARHHVHAVEWDTALHPTPRNRASYLEQDLMPVYEAGLFDIHDEKDVFEIVPGIFADHVGGHTPGEIIVRIEPFESDRVAVFVGDLIPTGAHVPVPWIMGYDLEPSRQVELKELLLAQWMDEKALIVFPHETRYPWAYVGKDEKGNYQADPLDIGWLEVLRRVKWPELP
jgi:glyoxylase-like metal-dependent hydrolase (beta-lactamase superfamily II)